MKKYRYYQLSLLALLAIAPAMASGYSAQSDPLSEGFSELSRAIAARPIMRQVGVDSKDIAEQNERMKELQSQNEARMKKLMDICGTGILRWRRLEVHDVYQQENGGRILLGTLVIAGSTMYQQKTKGFFPFIDGYLYHHQYWDELVDQNAVALRLTALEQGLTVIAPETCKYESGIR